MIEERNIEDLIRIAGSNNCIIDEPMSKHTTFRIGGPAKLFIAPQSIDVIKEVFFLLQKK